MSVIAFEVPNCYHDTSLRPSFKAILHLSTYPYMPFEIGIYAELGILESDGKGQEFGAAFQVILKPPV